ncbi:hypothetical protein B5F40_00790 [Gordonibacter sp. An230]|uniref:hypothetical protein n=1 Tax=Gordonibacter sp. An230 TaxID=1965592 RepID=UPI000B572A66|nr:hypothetical protein [Gordonibacter sp. An230]OUO92468.1 hypothetical protein B5F40_00790 [Gordonibacter sp. An230]
MFVATNDIERAPVQNLWSGATGWDSLGSWKTRDFDEVGGAPISEEGCAAQIRGTVALLAIEYVEFPGSSEAEIDNMFAFPAEAAVSAGYCEGDRLYEVKGKTVGSRSF